ncbi:MAG: hypothetical protein H6723_04825 [Sandaracinus sp.]|nr:hypothetical protein [Sandaracinus sp.]
MKRLAIIFAWSVLFAVPVAAQREPAPPRLEVEVRPFDEAGPWKRRLALRSLRAQEVVLDRRLLELTVIEPRDRGRPRRHTCRHPNAPRRPADERVRAMNAGESYEEWLDLRELCWGRALDVLERGEATVEVTYGFRARSAFVVREEGERRAPHRVDGASFTFTPPAASPAAEGSESPEVSVTLARVSTSRSPTLRVTLRGEGAGRAKRVYVRDDLFAFEVHGPLGTVRCEPSRTTIVPIVDFYKRLSRPIRTTIASELRCPDDTFEVPGVYEVVPRVDLVYDGTRYDLDALTGRFVGTAAPIRITSRSYVEQRVEDLLAILRPSSEEPSP